MTTLLIVTTGHTDVQLIVDGQKREFSKQKVGALHDLLQKRTTTWTVADAPTKKGPDIDSFPDGSIVLCTPKFDAVLSWFEGTLPQRLLILETRRPKRPGDPRFAGTVLKHRARELGIADVTQSAYLEAADENLEDSSPIDAIVRREVVQRIERAVAGAAEGMSRIVVAATGGMPEIKNLVRELARLHTPSGASFQSVEPVYGARNGKPDCAVQRESIDPVETVRLRWHALSLVEKGNLLGAWGAVSHLEWLPGQEWTQVIKWLAHFASSLPLPTGCDLAVLSHQRMAVRAALRVELSLRAGDIPRAVHGTVAFFEAALWDKLLEHFERDAKDIRWLKLRAKAAAPTGNLLRESGYDHKNRPFESKLRHDGQAGFWFHESGAGRFARCYVKSDPLKNLLDAIDKVKALRNDVAHNEPTPNLMNEARCCMRTATLWSNTDTFLSQRLVQDVLRELCEACPERICEDLITTIRSRLVAA